MRERPRKLTGWAAGTVAAALMGATMLALRMAAGIPAYPELIGAALSTTVPIGVFNFSTGTLGTQTKPVLFAVLTVIMVAVGGALGAWYVRRLWRPVGFGRGALLPAAQLGAGAWLVVMFGLSPLVGAGFLGVALPGGPTPYMLGGLLLFGLYAVTLAGMTELLRRAFAAPGAAHAPDEQRRALLHNLAIGGTLVVVGALAVQIRRFAFPDHTAGGTPAAPSEAETQARAIAQTARAQAQAAPTTSAALPAATPRPTAAPTRGATAAPNTAIPATAPAATAPANTALATETPLAAPSAIASGPADPIFAPVLDSLPAEVTDNDHFYVISKNFVDPVVNESGWQMKVGGSVFRPVSLTLADLRALPNTTFLRTMECISNRIEGDLISNGQWTGVPLRMVLESAGIKPEVVKVQFACEDGYTTAIPLAAAMDEHTILAYEMNGVPLPLRHGFPARLIIPARYGMKNPKWITEIAPTAEDYQGYWERQGWTDTSIVQTMSRIDTPTRGSAPHVGVETGIGGIAYAGARGIHRVDVSADDGVTWQETTLLPPLGPYTWVFWAARWTPTRPGAHTLVVRATDGTGAAQIGASRPPIPDGATGYHRVPLTVRS